MGGGCGGGREGTGRRDRGCESGVVCRGMVLLADIFIGGHATCNRARGIRTERCFAHLYPRSGDSPVRPPPPFPTPLRSAPLRSALALSLRLAIASAKPFFCCSLGFGPRRPRPPRNLQPESESSLRYRHIGCFAFFDCHRPSPTLPFVPRGRQNFLEICVSRSVTSTLKMFASCPFEPIERLIFRVRGRSTVEEKRGSASPSVQVSFHRGSCVVARKPGQRLLNGHLVEG